MWEPVRPTHGTVQLFGGLSNRALVPTFPRDIKRLVLLEDDMLVGEHDNVVSELHQHVSELFCTPAAIPHVLVGVQVREGP